MNGQTRASQHASQLGGMLELADGVEPPIEDPGTRLQLFEQLSRRLRSLASVIGQIGWLCSFEVAAESTQIRWMLAYKKL